MESKLFTIEDFISGAHYHSPECDSCTKLCYASTILAIENVRDILMNELAEDTAESILKLICDAVGLELEELLNE